MKIVLPGGTGHLGRVLAERLTGHELVVLSRDPAAAVPNARTVAWDGRTDGAWAAEVDGADAVVNLAGRTVNCRPTDANRQEMLRSRVDSATAVGRAIAAAARPPRVWLQASTATIYAHRFDAANDEATGVIGGGEPGAPASWDFSVRIAKEWEAALAAAETPATRRVALRTAIVMAPGRGGAFAMLLAMTRLGLGGPVGGGRQWVSWIHGDDFARALTRLLADDALDGPGNLAAPDPLPQRAFMAGLRAAAGVPLGVPATRWMAEAGALVLRSDAELLLKSRRAVPQRLLDAGFAFHHPDWRGAARDLVALSRAHRGRTSDTGA